MTVRSATRAGSRARKAKSVGRTPGKPGRVNKLMLLIALVGGLHVLAMLGVEFYRHLESRSEIRRLSDDVHALQAEIVGLYSVLEHKDDTKYREQLARKQGFMYPNERRLVTQR